MHARLLLLALLGLVLALPACPGSGGRGSTSDDDDDDSAADDDDVADDDDATTPPPPETECSDGLDNDGDGLTDCDDDDCAAVQYCQWPFALDHTGSFDYEASTAAELGGYDDCRTEFTVPLAFQTDSSLQCPTCDRTFTGPMTYPFDDCPEGDDPRPTEVTYGFVFFTALQWDIYVQDENAAWVLVGSAFDDGAGNYVHQRTDEVIVEEVDGGDLTTTLSFSVPAGD